MRIAFIQDHLRNGGTENQTLHIADGLTKAGLKTHVIVFRKGGILDEKAARGGFTLHYLSQGPLKTDWFAPGLNALLRALEIDIVIAMGRMGNCHAGRLLKKSRPYRVIATFRTGKAIPSLQQKALRKADAVIANSREALTRLKTRYRIENPNSAVIYNGCIRDSDSFSEEAPSPPEPPVRLVSASMFRPEKKQIRLLRICAKLPPSTNWHLTLAGDGPERERCIQEADRLGIQNRVDFPGLLSDPSDRFQRSHIAVHASSKESLPNALVEAQMYGLPVVAYDVGGVGETFDPGQSGYLVENGNETQFIEVLEKLIQSPDLRLQMSQAAREYALKHFTPESQIKAYTDLLKRINSGQ